ncbi:debranching enzyme-associated ribonuclease, putative [Plasmodium malariae]|uniref:Debranching enzyme-associated ribonuclease, putative n=1 Tax=Plasmodium malariae TaxID=5858 RepID=A0A1C3L2V5_PLAMA|nr:debranching enzyme-associated ribonuclease, putative [Plasmodium malariae]
MSDVDEFYEYAKYNFLKLLKKNNINSKDEGQRVKSREKESRIKGMNKKLLSDIENLKKDDLNDKESYDKKYINFLLKGKNKNSKSYKKEKKEISSSDTVSSSCPSYASLVYEKDKEHGREEEKKRKDDKHKKKCKEEERQNRKRKRDKKREHRKKRKEEKQSKHANKYEDNEGHRSVEIYEGLEKFENNEGYIKSEIKNASHGRSVSSDDSTKGERQNDGKSMFNKNEGRNMPSARPIERVPIFHLAENTKLSIKLENIITEKINKMKMKNALNKSLVDCKYCIDSNSFNKINKLNIISISDRSYICYYNYKNIFLKDQLFISPIEHTTSVTNTNFETIQDMRNHMKSLIAMLEENNETCIFVEFNNCFNVNIELISLRKTKHTYINCYVIPMELLEKAKIYFKKNMEDISSLYRENKQLIITNSKYAPYNVIPKNIPYISINFSLVETYIQVIENNYDYINMCKCIFTDLFKKDKLYKYFRNFQQYVNTVEQFKTHYEKYDWTSYVR